MTMHFHRPDHTSELFAKLLKEVVHVHDWLPSPAMSERDSLERVMAESAGWRCGITGR